MISGWEKAPEGLMLSLEEPCLSGECSVYPGHVQLGIPSVLSLQLRSWAAHKSSCLFIWSAWRVSAMSLSLTVLTRRAGWLGRRH